jgi:hypothetical protein
MNNSDITQLRLRNQGLSKKIFQNATDVVGWLGAVQAQDYAGAKWALGQRLNNVTNTALDTAFNEGKILRIHVLRPTWHFLAPEDIRWILMLSTPRVHAGNGFMYRQLELDRSIIRKSYAVLENALQGNKHLTRTELGSILEKAGIIAAGPRLAYILMSAELDGIVCSGPRKGKQFTYALVEERVPQVRKRDRDEALAELVRRYFVTRGPATLQDFTWWSGLTMADAKNGLEMVKRQFTSEMINGQTYWFADSKPPAKAKSPAAHLLPNYDEYFIGFKDRSAIGDVIQLSKLDANDPAFIANVIIVDGQLVGGWKRTFSKDSVHVKLKLIANLTEAEYRAVTEAAQRYGKFLALPVQLTA